MPLLPVIALLAFTRGASADAYALFAKNDAAIGKSVSEDPSPLVQANLEILVNTLRKSVPSEVDGIVAKFDRLAKKNDDGFATSFSWVSGSKATYSSFTALAVSYGPVGRVVLFEGDQRAKGGISLSYMNQRSPRILALNEEGLLIASAFVRDAGMRDNTRVDAVRILLGRARNSSSTKLVRTVEFEHTLDWGGVVWKNRRLVADSIDSPKSFFFAAPETRLRRHRVYAFVSGDLSLKEDRLGDPELRAVDAWMLRAQRTLNPTSEQARVRRLVPEPQMLLGFDVVATKGGSTVTLECDGANLVFRLSGSGSTYAVRSVSVK